MRYLVPLLLVFGLIGCAPYGGYPAGETAGPIYGRSPGYAANSGYYSGYAYQPAYNYYPSRPSYYGQPENCGTPDEWRPCTDRWGRWR